LRSPIAVDDDDDDDEEVLEEDTVVALARALRF